MSAQIKSQILKGVICFVETFTPNGTDSSRSIIDILHSLGAKVDPDFKMGLTHMIWLNGNIRHVKAAELMDIVVVSPSWILECLKLERRIDDRPFIIDSDTGHPTSLELVPEASPLRAMYSPERQMPPSHRSEVPHSAMVATSTASIDMLTPSPNITTPITVTVMLPSEDCKKKRSLSLPYSHSPTPSPSPALPPTPHGGPDNVPSPPHPPTVTKNAHHPPSNADHTLTSIGDGDHSRKSRNISSEPSCVEVTTSAFFSDSDGGEGLVDTPPSSPATLCSSARDMSSGDPDSARKRTLTRLVRGSPVVRSTPGTAAVVTSASSNVTLVEPKESVSKRKLLRREQLAACRRDWDDDAEGEGVKDGQWQCRACTFLNKQDISMYGNARIFSIAYDVCGGIFV